MGFMDWLLGPRADATTHGILSPFASPSDSLATITIAQLYPEHDTSKTLTRELALRIPAVKRAHDVTCGVLSRMPWALYDGPTRDPAQPRWLSTSASGLAPRTMRWGVYSDLFMYGWAAIGLELGDDELPVDALHLPFGSWEYDEKARRIVSTDAKTPSQYQQRIVAIPLGYGSNGILIDGIDTLRDARSIATAYRDRIDNPIAQTILTVTAEQWNGWTTKEREEFRQMWILGRSSAGGATAMKPDFVTVDFPGSVPADLFESGRNANRLDVANHAGLPASILEGAKQSAGGDMHYTSEANGGTRSELWDFGLRKYADAAEARLSLDDICSPGLSISVEAGEFLTAPTPTAPIARED